MTIAMKKELLTQYSAGAIGGTYFKKADIVASRCLAAYMAVSAFFRTSDGPVGLSANKVMPMLGVVECLCIAQNIGLIQARENFVADHGGVQASCLCVHTEVVEQDHEFVPAQSGDGVYLPNAMLKALATSCNSWSPTS